MTCSMRLTKILTLPILLIPCLGYAEPGGGDVPGDAMASLDTALPLHPRQFHPEGGAGAWKAAESQPAQEAQMGARTPKRAESADIQNVPGYHQDPGSLNAHENASAFHVQAAVYVQSQLKERQLELMEYRFTDTNADGSQEIVSLSSMEDGKHQRYLVVNVYDFDDNLAPILRYEKKQLIPGKEKTKRTSVSKQQYRQHIEAADPGFSLCEDWSIASWNIHECHLIQFDRAWMPRVMRHDIETSEPQAHSSQTNSFQFSNQLASRSYRRLPEGSFMPALSRDSQFVMVFVPLNENLEAAPTRLEYQQSSSFSEHVPFQFASAWNSEGLYLSFDFTDETRIEPASCTETVAVQQVDHAEFWFDLNPSLKIDRNNPESWMLEYEKDYQNEPYRHHIDNDIFGLAITSNGCIIPMTPTREQWLVMPEVNYETTEYGYRLDVYIPADFYGVEDLKLLNRSLGLGFTARQHDVDNEYRFSETATSEFKWPDPFTFGEIWLKPEGAAYPPHYPLQWSDWLDK